LAVPDRSINTFFGLRSRCNTGGSRECKYASARLTSSKIDTTRSSDIGAPCRGTSPPGKISSCNDRSISSIIKNRGELFDSRSTATPRNITMFGYRSDELTEHSLMKSRSTCCRWLVLRAPPMARSAASSVAMKNNRLTAILRPLLVHVARLTSPREPAPSDGDDSSMVNSSSGTRHSERAESSSTLSPSASHPIQSNQLESRCGSRSHHRTSTRDQEAH